MKGCSHQEPKYKNVYTTEIIAYIIEKFKGELI